MSTFTNLNYHIIFSTKYRIKSLSTSIQERIYGYIGSIIRELDGHLIEVGGIEDHVHILASLSPKHSISDVLRELKANSSRWKNDLQDNRELFQWQKGYSAYSVSYSQVGAVRRYIQNQHEHHRTKTFKEEYEEFLKRHNLNYDPKYLFEAEPSSD